MANYARNHVCFLFSARVHYQPILLLGMVKLIWWAPVRRPRFQLGGGGATPLSLARDR